MYFKGSFVRINSSYLKVHDEYITAGLGLGSGSGLVRVRKAKSYKKNKLKKKNNF